MNLGAEITKLFDEYKQGRWSDVNNRMKFADSLIERYFLARGERPSKQDLDRLATFLLLDELSDTNRHKMKEAEYPTMSDRMERGRRESEVSFVNAEEVGIDRRSYRRPTRTIRKK